MAQQSPSPAFNAAALTEPVSLWRRIENSDMEGLKQILDAFPDIWRIPVETSKNHVKGDQAIHIAARLGNMNAVGLLASHGAGLEDRNEVTGETPFLASLGGVITTPARLAAMGADRHARDKDGRTGLHIAAANGWALTASQLAEQLKLDIEAADDAGDTPLMSAVRGKKAEAAKLLLDLGAKPDITAKDGMTPLELSRQLKEEAPDEAAFAALHDFIATALETARRTSSIENAKEVSWHISHGAGRQLASLRPARFRPQPPPA